MLSFPAAVLRDGGASPVRRRDWLVRPGVVSSCFGAWRRLGSGVSVRDFLAWLLSVSSALSRVSRDTRNEIDRMICCRSLFWPGGRCGPARLLRRAAAGCVIPPCTSISSCGPFLLSATASTRCCSCRCRGPAGSRLPLWWLSARGVLAVDRLTDWRFTWMLCVLRVFTLPCCWLESPDRGVRLFVYRS